MRRARGVALILALVVVAIATVIATRIGAEGALDQRRGATLLAQEQAFQVALGAETWAIEVLSQSFNASPAPFGMAHPSWSYHLPSDNCRITCCANPAAIGRWWTSSPWCCTTMNRPCSPPWNLR